jgi:intracellular sulfur oxidation DsrE/DsrF family protein
MRGPAMSKKILQVIESGYRATVEEQDDTVVWFTHAMKGGGADVAVVLRGHAVNYGVKGQDASGITFGDKKQTQPPDLAGDLARLLSKGVEVYVVEEDVTSHGLVTSELIGGLRPIARSGLPALLGRYDLIWHW